MGSLDSCVAVAWVGWVSGSACQAVRFLTRTSNPPCAGNGSNEGEEDPLKSLSFHSAPGQVSTSARGVRLHICKPANTMQKTLDVRRELHAVP
jgi:hypothetical protein